MGEGVYTGSDKMIEAQMFDPKRKGDTSILDKEQRNRYYDTWLTEEVYKKELLFKWADMMDDLGYKFFIAYGTLLGAIRNNRCLPWDTDIDVMLVIGDGNEMWNPEEDFDIFGIVREAHKRGFKAPRFDHYYSIGYHESGEWCKHPELLKLPLEQQTKAFMKLEGEHTTLGPPWFNDRFNVEWKGKSIDGWICHYTKPAQRHFMTHSTVEFYGRTFLAAGDVESYLAHYGPNWRDVFCPTPMWKNWSKELQKGIVREEIQIFMEEFNERDKLYRSQPPSSSLLNM